MSAEKWVHFEDKAEAKGYAQISNALLRSRHISLQAKGFYALLKSYAWEDPDCFPGIKRLREDTGASDNTLKKYRDELIQANLLEVKRRGRGQTNLYIFKSVGKFLESHTGAKQESHMPSDQESHTGANNEDSVDKDATDNTSNDVDGQPSPGQFVGYLREELDGADVPLLRNREERYAGEFNKLIKKGVAEDVLYKICDRIAQRWRGDEHHKLTAEHAMEDVVNGKPPAHASVTPLPAWEKGTPPEIIDYVFENTRTDYIRTCERRLRSTMARFDFTSEEQPPWKIEKELGGTDNERWGTLDALRSLCRRGQREIGGAA